MAAMFPGRAPQRLTLGLGLACVVITGGATTSSATTTPPPQTNLASSDPAVPVATLGSGSNTSTSVAPEPRGDLRGIRWHACPTAQVATLMCGTLAVPYDYANPAGPKFVLAVAKVPALGRKVGTLFFDPGGPGGAGAASTGWAATQMPMSVREKFDVVGWDPRGIGDTRPALQGCAQPQPVLPATHRIRSLRTYAFPEPDIKSGPPLLLTMNALVTVEGMDGRFARVARGGYVPQAHLGDLLDFETDAAGVAELYLGAPYQWGGRESVGLDCSGLVQQALLACGKGCPRDADMQEAELGEPIAGDARARGDLVFWKDHVAMLLDAERLIHANGFHMAVAVESLESAIARNGAPTGFRRP